MFDASKANSIPYSICELSDEQINYLINELGLNEAIIRGRIDLNWTYLELFTISKNKKRCCLEYFLDTNLDYKMLYDNLSDFYKRRVLSRRNYSGDDWDKCIDHVINKNPLKRTMLTKDIIERAKNNGIQYQTLSQRVRKLGWSVEEACVLKPDKGNSKKRKMEV